VLGAAVDESYESSLVGSIDDGAVGLLEEIVSLHRFVKVAGVSRVKTNDSLSLVRLNGLDLFTRIICQ
jgi:hypothetical protein